MLSNSGLSVSCRRTRKRLRSRRRRLSPVDAVAQRPAVPATLARATATNARTSTMKTRTRTRPLCSGQSVAAPSVSDVAVAPADSTLKACRLQQTSTIVHLPLAAFTLFFSARFLCVLVEHYLPCIGVPCLRCANYIPVFLR